MVKIKRGDIYKDVEIVDIASDGKAIGKVDGLVIFVTGCIPGDVVDVKINKTRRRYHEGIPVNFSKHSENRIEAKCKYFGVCGGCKWQNMNYGTQLKYKHKQVEENLIRIGKAEIEQINNILPAEDIFYYRNKLEFTFTNKRWLTENEIEDEVDKNMNGLGFHVPGMFSKVVDIEECFLQIAPSNEIKNEVRSFAKKHKITFFDIKNQNGFLRNLIVRTSNNNDVMVIVVLFYEDKALREALLEHLSEKFPEITSLMYVINPKKNDSINDLDVHLYKGKDFLTETMDNLHFKIGPKSFFQTNSKQAYLLYNIVKDYASLNGTETVYDLYTGTGTIGMFIASDAKEVVGVEYVEEAIINAKENAKLNHISNIQFVCGVMEKIFDDTFTNLYGLPDVVITDPPRSGMHAKVISQLLKLLPEKIVYVSCNPATQARDIEMLSEKYTISKIQAVDMFPHTAHVECVALLVKK